MRGNRIIMNVIISSLLGVALCFLIKSITVQSDLLSNTVFIAEFAETVQSGQLITAEVLLSELPNVRKSSVQLVRAAAAFEEMKSEMPELKYMADNPFRHIITFKTEGLAADNLPNFESQVKGLAGIEQVYYDRDFLSTLSGSFSNVRLGISILSLILCVGTLIALGLRIKRDIRTYKDDIKVLTIAGASSSSIMKSRLNWSIKWGAISALIAAVVSMINIFFINQTLLSDLEITFLQAVLAILLMVGLVIGAHALVTYQIIKSYLIKLNPSITL